MPQSSLMLMSEQSQTDENVLASGESVYTEQDASIPQMTVTQACSAGVVGRSNGGAAIHLCQQKP